MLEDEFDFEDCLWLKDEFDFEENPKKIDGNGFFEGDVFNESIFNEKTESFEKNDIFTDSEETENISFNEKTDFFEQNENGDIYEFFENGQKEIFNSETRESNDRFSQSELTSLKEVEKIGEGATNMPISISLNIDAQREGFFDAEKILRAVTERLREELTLAAEGLYL